jgi:hypothetical protein
MYLTSNVLLEDPAPAQTMGEEPTGQISSNIEDFCWKVQLISIVN